MSVRTPQKLREQGEVVDNGRAEKTDDPTFAALDALIATLEVNARERQIAVNRLNALREERRAGMRWQDILSKEEPPGTMHMVSEILAGLSESSGVLRKELVTQLRREGTSIPAIARMFGVTHQRVSNLLRRTR